MNNPRQIFVISRQAAERHPGLRHARRAKTYSVLRQCLVATALLAPAVGSALDAVQLNGDGNSGISVHDMRVGETQTTLLYGTWPDRGDAGFGARCALNFYTLTLAVGESPPAPESVATAVCGSRFATGKLHDDEALLLLDKGLERWRGGERLTSLGFSEMPGSRGLVRSLGEGMQAIALTDDGGLVLASAVGPRQQADLPSGAMLVRSLDARGETRWQASVAEPSILTADHWLWAGDDGGALLRHEATVPGTMVPETAHNLYSIDRNGKLRKIALTRAAAPFVIEPGAGREALRAMLQQQQDQPPERIPRLAASPRPDGGFDVLFERRGSTPARSGHFLLRLGADGSTEVEYALGELLAEHGLEHWREFYVRDGQLFLLGQVTVSYEAHGARRSAVSQNALSRVALASGQLQETRLLPLQVQYLEAFLNAGDEQIKDLPGHPVAGPVALSRLGGAPLAVSVGYTARRNDLRLQLAGAGLPTWDEVYNERQSQRQSEQARQQQRQQADQYQSAMEARLAANVGLTPEEYRALDNRQRKDLLVRQGDLDALVTMATQMAAQVQAGASADPQAVAAAMGAINTPGTGEDPAAGKVSGGESPADEAAGVNAGEVVALDSANRGFVEFQHSGAKSVTLIISNRKTGEELLRKDYTDGTVYEYLEFSRFGLPLEHIAVMCRDGGGEVVFAPALVAR
ncbi:hypothetical protein DWB85_17640 [Seongchinamella sediminis]|uniref:Uncharacterized protein n=1 Tax=Seongchinamella sediminis TaxID=2283635 RepID=A0A3L7DUH5_9GAMM|nr:hypothetical protein [Seongchinamella sediminis]RLQ20435.1 hypothetical protein DWB85_17640 [Seongchinamella sediminis]